MHGLKNINVENGNKENCKEGLQRNLSERVFNVKGTEKI